MDVSTASEIRLPPAGHAIGHKKILLAGIIISLFIIVLALSIANSRTSFFGRAASSSSSARIAGNLSLENSYLFASPISAAADGSSAIRVTVIVLNDQGLGVGGREITLKTSDGSLKITPVSPTSDTFGRAIFDLSSSSPGNYTITAEVSNAALPQTVSVAFR